MKQHNQTVNIYLQTSSVTVQGNRKLPGIPQKKIEHCTVGVLGKVLGIIMSTASSSTLYPIFTDKRLRAHSPGPVSRRRSPPRRESPPRKRARANSKERSLSPGKKPVKSRIELPLSSRLGIQGIPSPRSQSPRPSTSPYRHAYLSLP